MYITVDEHGRYGALPRDLDIDDMPHDPGTYGCRLEAGTRIGAYVIVRVLTRIFTAGSASNYINVEIEPEGE